MQGIFGRSLSGRHVLRLRDHLGKLLPAMCPFLLAQPAPERIRVKEAEEGELEDVRGYGLCIRCVVPAAISTRAVHHCALPISSWGVLIAST